MQKVIVKFLILCTFVFTETLSQSIVNSRESNDEYEYVESDCLRDEFYCAEEGMCIELIRQCDGVSDCNDNSDEVNCTSVNATQSPVETTTGDDDYYYSDCTGENDFDCGGAICINVSLVCNGEQDCPGAVDEENCPSTTASATTTEPSYYGVCDDGDFECLDTGLCIPTFLLCDGTADCSDSSDEVDCGGTGTTSPVGTTIDTDYGGCIDDEFECVGAGLCIPLFLVCDGTADCSDSSDEVNCDVTESSTPAPMVHTTTQPAVTCIYEGVIYPAGSDILITNCTEIMCSRNGHVLTYEDPACAGTHVTPTLPSGTTPSSPTTSQNLTIWIVDFNQWRITLFSNWIPTVKRYINIVKANDVEYSCPPFSKVTCLHKLCVTFPEGCLYCYCPVVVGDKLPFLHEVWKRDVLFWKQVISPVWEALFQYYKQSTNEL